MRKAVFDFMTHKGDRAGAHDARIHCQRKLWLTGTVVPSTNALLVVSENLNFYDTHFYL